MKVHVSPPKNKDLFYHEAQTARKARYIISGLQMLSGATALIGLRIYFDEWLTDMHWVLQYLIMAGIAFVLVAPGEIGIRETWAYLFRAILNRYNKGLDLFSIILMLCVAFSLTGYSFYLSQYATKNSLKRVAPTVILEDTKHVSQAYESEMSRIATDYATKRNDINSRYSDLIQAERDYYANQVTANEAKIDQYKKREWSTGQRYTSRINNLETQNLNLETQQSEAIKEIKTKQNGELMAIETWRSTAEQEARTEKTNSKSSITDRNQVLEEENQAFANMFASLVARFAAWSVVLVILFTGYLEVFYYKTGIKRVVKFKTTDFQAPVLVELLSFPYVYMSRHLANFVRSKYHTLPALVPAPGTENMLADDDFADYVPTSDPSAPPLNRTKASKRKTARAEESVSQDASASKHQDSLSFWSDNEEETVEKPRGTNEQAGSENTRYGQEDLAGTVDQMDHQPGTLFYQEKKQKDSFSHQESSGEASSDSSSIRKQQVEQVSFTDTSSAFQDTGQDDVFREKLDDDPQKVENVSGVSIKHVDRRTGQISYFDIHDLDGFIDEYQEKVNEATEMYHDTGDPMYLAAIEDARSGLGYWQGRKMECLQKMSSNNHY